MTSSKFTKHTKSIKMHSYDTSVLFVCRLCKASFQIVDDFIEHKKGEHSVEFLTSNCIVFEDILILNTSNDEEKNCGMLSTTVKEKGNPVPLKTSLNVPLVGVGIENSLTEAELSQSPEHISHDDPAGECQPFPISTFVYQNDDNRENFSYQYQDADETCDNSLHPNHVENETYNLQQASPYVSFNFKELKTELTEFERDQKVNWTASDAFTLGPQHPPYILLKKLSSKEIQKYSRLENQDINQAAAAAAEVTSESRCKLCLKKFNSEAELEIHCRVCILDSTKRDRYCSPCKRLFNSKWARNKHKIRVHGTKEEKRALCKFKCNVCQKVYMKKESLIYHNMASHEETSVRRKPLKCDACSASFFEKHKLRRHEAIHGLTRPFQCPEPDCGKAFKLQEYLTQHLKCTHANIGELFNCPESDCTSAFKYKRNFNRHIKTCHMYISRGKDPPPPPL